MLAYTDRTPDLHAEYQDLQRQRPALVVAVRTCEETAAGACETLNSARTHYDRAVRACRDARRWADVAADRLRRHDAALAEVRAELIALPERGTCAGVAQHGA